MIKFTRLIIILILAFHAAAFRAADTSKPGDWTPLWNARDLSEWNTVELVCLGEVRPGCAATGGGPRGWRVARS